MTDHVTETDTDIGESETGRVGNGRSRPRKRTSRTLWVGLTALVVAGAGAGVFALVQNGAPQVADTPAGPVATAEVIRENLADTRSFNGVLGHGEPLTVTTSGQGVITGLAGQGSSVEPGTELFRLNEQPVIAMEGIIPMYRDLSHGAEGVDVEQLIANLTEWGYADCQATDEFTWCVDAAVRDWQADIGATETGTVAQTDVVFLPQGGRVDSVHARVGDVIAPGSAVLDLTGTEHIVSLEIEVRDRDRLPIDTEVTVQLPAGGELAGTVTASNIVAADAGGMGDAGADDTVARVEVTLDEAVDESVLGAPATVFVEIGERTGVLTVPVNALLALSEGGHAVEVVAEDGTTELVPVETGLFAGGRVEITGEGIAEGTVVGVAGR